MTEKKVRLKKDGTPMKKPGSKTPEGKARQSKTQFKKGCVGPNPLGGRMNFRKPTVEMREKVHQALIGGGIPMLINMLYDSFEAKDRKDMLAIIEFMFKYAYGTPREMHDYEELDKTPNNSNNRPVIMVSREDLLTEMESDKLYE